MELINESSKGEEDQYNPCFDQTYDTFNLLGTTSRTHIILHSSNPLLALRPVFPLKHRVDPDEQYTTYGPPILTQNNAPCQQHPTATWVTLTLQPVTALHLAVQMPRVTSKTTRMTVLL
jgi:hypothetical protein